MKGTIAGRAINTDSQVFTALTLPGGRRVVTVYSANPETVESFKDIIQEDLEPEFNVEISDIRTHEEKDLFVQIFVLGAAESRAQLNA